MSKVFEKNLISVYTDIKSNLGLNMLRLSTTLSQHIPTKAKVEREFNALPFKKIALYSTIVSLALIILTGNSRKAGKALLDGGRIIAPHLVTKTALVACLKAFYEVYGRK